jgi:hypothetical protein
VAETIGSLVDKLSIIGLKIYHMQEQVDRKDASAEHRENCRRRVEVMQNQKKDLAEELNELSKGVLAGTRVLKVYRQFKMYNDPAYRK